MAAVLSSRPFSGDEPTVILRILILILLLILILILIRLKHN